MPSALQLAQGNAVLTAAVVRCRKYLHRRALLAGAASTLPVPGFDWVVDAALLSRIIPEINQAFGLTPAQIEQLAPSKQEQVQVAVGTVGSFLIGRLVTKELVLKAAQAVGVRLTTQQAVKYVPLAGQVVSAVVGYSVIRHLGEQHLKDCVRVAQMVQDLLPAPA
ncbi:MAG: hypothetical protein RIS34_1743 [Pseudomonadota bacterium]|jgi:uncharacterized protein (DUF697 family)